MVKISIFGQLYTTQLVPSPSSKMTRAIAKLSLRSRLTIKATEPRGPAIERVGREYRLWLDAIWGRTQSCLIKQPVTSDTVCKNFATLNLYEFAAWHSELWPEVGDGLTG